MSFPGKGQDRDKIPGFSHLAPTAFQEQHVHKNIPLFFLQRNFLYTKALIMLAANKCKNKLHMILFMPRKTESILWLSFHWPVHTGISSVTTTFRAAPAQGALHVSAATELLISPAGANSRLTLVISSLIRLLKPFPWTLRILGYSHTPLGGPRSYSLCF